MWRTVSIPFQTSEAHSFSKGLILIVLARKLSECEIYYSSGKCGLEKEIVKWFQPFVNSCPDIKSFVFFTPGQDYGSLENSMIRTMAKAWEKLESLEVSGEDITLEGIVISGCKT